MRSNALMANLHIGNTFLYISTENEMMITTQTHTNIFLSSVVALNQNQSLQRAVILMLGLLMVLWYQIQIHKWCSKKILLDTPFFVNVTLYTLLLYAYPQLSIRWIYTKCLSSLS